MAIIMKGNSSITIDNDIVTVDPPLLFQRLLAVSLREDKFDLKEVFKYELSTIPASLFDKDKNLMLNADKPQLAESIWEVAGPGQESVPSGSTYVLDDGSLMFRVKWLRDSTFSQIFKDYELYVLNNFGENAEIVFDGGYEKASTKDTVHIRRTNGKVGQEVKFSESMKLTKTRSYY